MGKETFEIGGDLDQGQGADLEPRVTVVLPQALIDRAMLHPRGVSYLVQELLESYFFEQDEEDQFR